MILRILGKGKLRLQLIPDDSGALSREAKKGLQTNQQTNPSRLHNELIIWRMQKWIDFLNIELASHLENQY